MPELFVFKAGKYPQANWPVERVQKFVDAYDPVNGIEAPAVIGHRMFAIRDADQYAHGWVESVRMDKDGKVFATINNFSLEARHAIAEGKLRYISAEIYEFDKKNKDEPPYLRAIALLGRDTPAVTGTKIPAMFSLKSFLSGGVVNAADEENHVTTFTRRVNAEDVKLLSVEGRKTTEEAAMKTAEELQAELEKSNARIAELEKNAGELAAFRKENEELKNAGKKQEAETFFSKLRDEGKLPIVNNLRIHPASGFSTV
jgi:phage I-like protein